MVLCCRLTVSVSSALILNTLCKSLLFSAAAMRYLSHGQQKTQGPGGALRCTFSGKISGPSSGGLLVDAVAFASVRPLDLHTAKHHDEFGGIDLKVTVITAGDLFKGSALESLEPQRQT